jgi:hypothetical protein
MEGDEQQPRMIFRAEALRRHARGAVSAPAPQLAPPRRAGLLWLAVGCLIAGGLAFWLAAFAGRFFGE